MRGGKAKAPQLATARDIDTLMRRAVAAHHAGQLPVAEAIYREVLVRCPGFPDACHLLGVVYFQRGELAAAEQSIRAAISGRSEVSVFWFNLGNVVRQSGRADEAMRCFERAWQLQPGYVAAAANLGNLLFEAQRPGEALTWYERALERQANDAISLNGAGTCLGKLGRIAEAEVAFKRAIACSPGYLAAQINLSRLLMGSERKSEALALADRIRPHCEGDVALLQEIGVINENGKRFAEAIDAFRAALQLAPQHAPAITGLANSLRESWQHEESLATFRSLPSLVEAPDPLCWQCFLMSLIYFGASSPEEMLMHHRRYESLLGIPPATAQALSSDVGERRVRVGFVSPDFRLHACAHFLLPLFENIDHSRFEVFCYSSVRRPDAITARFRGLADHWFETFSATTDELTDHIRSDHIDILFDLAGHTDGSHLPVFARRAAPVQVSWLGYPATSGLSTIDYRLTDQIADPPGRSDSHASERLVRMPEGFLCYAPLVETEPPGASAAACASARAEHGIRPLTFGSFNNLGKVTPAVLTLWAQITLRAPEAQLYLKAPQLDDADVRERVLAFLDRAGLPRERVRLRGSVDMELHLRSFLDIDVALDPFPYNGTTTTCEALWMGVPVIALVGESHAARVSASILGHLGCPELIATDHEAYASIALGLVSDPQRLLRYRETLRERFRQSPLGDAAGFSRRFEATLRQILLDASVRRQGSPAAG